MPIRKPHSKSRFGCLPCKKRHIKCGEETPSCLNCINRHVECAYGMPALNNDSHLRTTGPEEAHHFGIMRDESKPMNSTFSPSAQKPTTQSFPAISRVQELQLAIHYTASTCETMAHGPHDLEIWKTVIPEQALQYDYLMDGILALSSLHYAFQNPDQRWQYAQFAIQYQSSGLKKFKAALESITPENQGALFAYSVIINVLSLAFPNACPEAGHSHVGSILTMMELVRGIGMLVASDEASIRHGRYAAFFQTLPPAGISLDPKTDTSAALLRLRGRVRDIAGPMGHERHQVYLSGIESLETSFGSMELSSRHLGYVIVWPTTISEKLSGLFKQGDAMAQLIFIHYGVLLLYARENWWGRDTGVRLIESLSVAMHDADPEWEVWTKWARERASLVSQAGPRS